MFSKLKNLDVEAITLCWSRKDVTCATCLARHQYQGPFWKWENEDCCLQHRPSLADQLAKKFLDDRKGDILTADGFDAQRCPKEDDYEFKDRSQVY